MKHVCYVVLGILIGLPAAAHAQTWHMATDITQADGSSAFRVCATVPDRAGNVYVAGSFWGTIGFGRTKLHSAGGPDIFVAKWCGAQNRFLWAERAGGTGADLGAALAVDGNTLYVAGEFGNEIAGFIGSTAAFGPATLASVGGSDAFVAKLTDHGSAGTFDWAKQAGGSGNDEATSLALSGHTLYVSGLFAQKAIFGSTVLSTNNPADSSPDIFVAKILDAGPTAEFGWVQRAGNSRGYDYHTQLAASGSSVYVAGIFWGTATFGSTSVTATGLHNAFLAKLKDAGDTSSFVWSQRVGSTGNDYLRALVAQGNSVYIAGYFDGPTAQFGTISLANTVQPVPLPEPPLKSDGIVCRAQRYDKASSADVFVAKLVDAGPSGHFVWALGAGGKGGDGVYGLAVQGKNVYVTGFFAGQRQQGAAQVGITARFGKRSLTSVGHADGFLAALTDEGVAAHFDWAQAVGSAAEDVASTVAVVGPAIWVGGELGEAAGTFGRQRLRLTPSRAVNTSFIATFKPTQVATAARPAVNPRE